MQGYLTYRVQHAWQMLNWHGPRQYLGRLAQRWGQGLYKRHDSIVFRRDLRAPVQLLPAKVALTVEAYTEPRREEVFRFLDHHMRRDLAERHLADGWTPMLGFYEGELVALSWFTLSPLYLDSVELYLDYGGRSGYIEGTYTDDRMRGLGVAPAVRSHICAYLRELGCDQVFVAVGEDNTSSQAVARKCGFSPFESICLRRLLGWRRYQRHRLQP
ncbi:MAG TPA: GNAT family N-acetyltransferase [Candidatus Competibacteraceae bacterium]|nr:GNAT family N-acetyltransferase [Candidatus Competibacteraceae bacterium]